MSEVFLLVVGPCAAALALWNFALDHGWGQWTRISASAGAAVATVVVLLLVIFFPSEGEDGKESAAPLALLAALEREEPQG